MNLDTSSVNGNWPYLGTLVRLTLAIGLGLFVGLERERRGKEAGVRTFAFVTALGCIGGLLGDAYALTSLVLLIPFVIFLNLHALKTEGDTEMTTSISLLIMGFVGILCGKGHTFTPVTLGLATAGLLAWKTPLSGFSIGITETELRSAILLGVIAFVVYPVLPNTAIDRWGLIVPQAVWITVILITAMGFGNYILLKLYGSKGVLTAAFLAGLINSTVAVTELAARAQVEESLKAIAYKGALLSTGAMLLRNAAILAILAPTTLYRSGPVFFAMFIVSIGLALWPSKGIKGEAIEPTIQLDSPFSLKHALKFGLLFLALSVLGTLAQRSMGKFGFYSISAIGGFISSASAVGSSAQLAQHGNLSVESAAIGAILASIASAVVNVPLIWRISRDRKLGLAVAIGTAMVLAAGFIFMAIL